MALFIGSGTVLNPPRHRKFSILLIGLPGSVPTLNTLPCIEPRTSAPARAEPGAAGDVQEDNREAELDNQSFPSFGLAEKF